MQIGQNRRRKHIDPSQQVVSRDHRVEAKLIKELPLISVLPPHHRRLSCRLLSRNHCSLGSSSPFSTASARLRHAYQCRRCPFTEVDRKSPWQSRTDANDPERTLCRCASPILRWSSN